MRLPRLISAVTVMLALVATVWVASAQAAYPVARNGRIVFDRLFNFKGHVLMMNADGSGATDLSPASTPGDFDPQFSPNGRWIAFSRAIDASGEVSHLFLMRPNGTGAVDLTPGLTEPAGEPTFSPDGKQIAFVMDIHPGPGGVFTIAIMNADGSGIRDLTPDSSAYELRPDFSPDGSKIVFDREDPSQKALFTMNPDGSGVKRLTPPGSVVDSAGAFSPTGTRLAWVRNPDFTNLASTYDVNVGDTALGGAADITPDGPHPYKNEPSFSPDGTKVAYVAYDPMADQEIFVSPVAGGSFADLSPQANPLDDWPHWEYVYRCAKRRATIVGDDGPDVIKGTKKADVIVGNGGNDRIKGKGGNDRICGGSGDDRLIGGAGKKDRLVGGPGKDKVSP